MPYCVSCGTLVGAPDRFCVKCGAPQPVAGGTAPGSRSGTFRQVSDSFKSISDRNAELLCYIPTVGWIPCILVLASQRFRRNLKVRFHAFQGLYLFVVWLFIQWVVSPALFLTGGATFPLRGLLTGTLEIVVLAAWIVMIVKVAQHEDYRLPIVGELADRSVREQPL